MGVNRQFNETWVLVSYKVVFAHIERIIFLVVIVKSGGSRDLVGKKGDSV